MLGARRPCRGLRLLPRLLQPCAGGALRPLPDAARRHWRPRVPGPRRALLRLRELDRHRPGPYGLRPRGPRRRALTEGDENGPEGMDAPAKPDRQVVAVAATALALFRRDHFGRLHCGSRAGSRNFCRPACPRWGTGAEASSSLTGAHPQIAIPASATIPPWGSITRRIACSTASSKRRR